MNIIALTNRLYCKSDLAISYHIYFGEVGFYADGSGWCRLGGAFMVDVVENAEEKEKRKGI